MSQQVGPFTTSMMLWSYSFEGFRAGLVLHLALVAGVLYAETEDFCCITLFAGPLTLYLGWDKPEPDMLPQAGAA